ncbi:hypothetical protein [Methylomonas rosea]|uniref:Uncharacterized protein n=1 Tax=Methylomonas rosea TaxID=2952227 RepID=A0ABT1TVC3_9GAMM|nr:hypothetical protein [Methylomonas sp. WSC-7]MCQ8118717.1 hypothetical protein [Methylomonas sp. WSC-7]
MRFFVTGEQNRQLLINTLILMFLAYVALLWISNGLMYFHKMNLTPESVVSYYLGNEQEFNEPKSYQSLLEVSHFHLFAMGMLVLTLTHLMLMTSLPTLMKVWISVIVYAAAIADEAAGWLVRYVDPAFAYFKIAAFLLLETSLFLLIVIVSLSLIESRRQLR